jgi:hypothetical protein
VGPVGALGLTIAVPTPEFSSSESLR